MAVKHQAQLETATTHNYLSEISFRVMYNCFYRILQYLGQILYSFLQGKKPPTLPPISHIIHWTQILKYIKINLSNLTYFNEMLKKHYKSLSSAFRIHLQFSSSFSISLHIRKPKCGTHLYIKTVIKCHVKLEHLNYSSDFWSLIPLV